MDLSHSVAQSQRLLRQRNLFAGASGLLALLVVILFLVGATRKREIVLQPVSRTPITITSAGASREYLELVTRDTALMVLNRSPHNLQYWMESVLAIASPRSYGSLKRDLMKIVTEQTGSSVSQFYTIDTMKVDPEQLVSEVSGTLHTVVGSKEMTSEAKRFRFTWEYDCGRRHQGQSTRFRAVSPDAGVSRRR